MVRAARRSVAVSLGDVAAAAGVQRAEMVSALRTVAARGRCDKAAAMLAAHSIDPGLRTVGVAHSACPPPLRRAATFSSVAPLGVSGWEGRPFDHPRRPRRCWGFLSGSPPQVDLGVAADDAACPALTLAAIATNWGSAIDVVEALAHNPNCGPETVTWLASGAGVSIPGVPEADLGFAAVGATGMRSAAANHPNLPAAAAARLMVDPHRLVRAAAAANPACDPEHVAVLARDPDLAVRAAAAANPACPDRLLAGIAGDPERRVRSGLARNPSCPPRLLASLGSDSDDLVRCHAAEHPDCPPLVLAALALDPEAMVAAEAFRNPRCPSRSLQRFADPRVVDTTNEDLSEAAAANPECPPPVLAVLAAASDELAGVREAAAANPGCPPLVLAVLAQDELIDLSVVAANPQQWG